MLFNQTTAKKSLDAYYRDIDAQTRRDYEEQTRHQGRPSPASWRASDVVIAAMFGDFLMWAIERIGELFR